jgi:hypothetical protein
MKTAMEQALARIEMLYIEKDSVHWEMFKNDCMEKEKEQIIETFDNGIYVGTYAVDKDGEEYYNQTYNK